MRAIVYTRYGPADVLHLDEVDVPIAKENEALIRVHAVEVTKADCELRSFNFAVKWFWLPLRIALGLTKPKRKILGGYFSGVVESVGKDVSNLAVGEQVFGCAQLRMGAYAEYVCLPASYTIVTRPGNLTDAEAAAVPLGGLNALHFLNRANIQPGEKVLINGAGGSIGTMAVQIAKSRGAEVTAVDAGIKEAMLRELGVDHFYDYQKSNFASNSIKYDVIFNMVARSSYADCIKSLEPHGRYLLGNPRMSDMVRAVLTSRLSDKKVMFAFAAETRQELLELKDMIEAGLIKPVVDRIYLLEQAPEAHRRVETERRLGCVVMSVIP